MGWIHALVAPLAPPREWLQAALAALVPPSCCACAAPLTAAAGPLCSSCRRALPWLRGERCPLCALASHRGARCGADGGGIDRAWAPLAYEGPARALVLALKLRGARPVADAMAAAIAAGAPAGTLDAGAALVPVPSHPRRRRARGFDHAELLARALATRTGLELAPCLRREGRPLRQAGASRAARIAPGRLRVVASGVVPASAVLVDDVHTTGATLRECASALRDGGAREVVAVTYARAVG